MSISSERGKYAPLQDFLKNRSLEMGTVNLTFRELEHIFGFDLPKSASTYSAWWGNEMKTHSHARAWLEVGYMVESLKLGESVTFTKKTIGKVANKLDLTTPNASYRFFYTALKFVTTGETNLFARKNNRTVEETLLHNRYSHLDGETREKYPTSLTMQLGDFLLDLKNKGDQYYEKFLNQYGDLEYGRFLMESEEHKQLKGLYAYVTEGEIKYIGRCLDQFGKRINQGYGVIHPKNCFKDGQATNCHLNAQITKEHRVNEVFLYLLPMSEDEEIKELELELIRYYCPNWNVSGKK